MSTTRLTFLYPHIFRSIRNTEPAITQSARARARSRSQKPRYFVTTEHRAQVFVQRHGKAVDPFLHGDAAEDVKVFLLEEDAKDKVKVKAVNKEGHQKDTLPLKQDNSSLAPLSEETQAAASLPEEKAEQYQHEAQASEQAQEVEAPSEVPPPVETVLMMPPPESPEAENRNKPPHLQTPPYVHHFDTYTLVQQVEAGGFSKNQSITAMKAVRGLLDVNLDVAKAGLVSKSDVENETYLFRAACSELKTEVQNVRKASEEKMRQERIHLQHEVDILNQKLSQELLTLKDDLKGMFDDRKMTVRQEQRVMESAIQQLNYKITVLLNSDSKSEVESMRWILAKRSVWGILFMAFSVLTSLRYASYKSHEEEVRKKKRAEGIRKGEVMEDLPAPGAAEILAAN